MSESDCPKNDHEWDSRCACNNITALRPAAEDAMPDRLLYLVAA
jgi:hypothetical protein